MWVKSISEKGEGNVMRIKKAKKLVIILLMFFSMFGINLMQDVDVVEAVVTNEGLNDEILNADILKTLGNNPDQWDRVFEEKWKDFKWYNKTATDDWRWNGKKANAVVGKSADDPMVIPETGDAIIEVYSPHQLAYLFEMVNNTPNFLQDKTISIKKDFDFAGYDYAWVDSPNLLDVTILGNNHTFYNIGSQKSFIQSMTNSKMEKLNFVSAKLVSETKSPPNKDGRLLGIIGEFEVGTSVNDLSYVRVQDSIIFSAYPFYSVASGDASYAGPFGESLSLKADHIATVNNAVYAVKAHVGGLIAKSDSTTITNSYSVDSVVIAKGNHSGGFISCSDGGIDVTNSFTNNEVYGNEQTGVFIGIIVENNKLGGSFKNCYTSGSIEGTTNLGGFIGEISPYPSGSSNNFKVSFTNCYSTSIVGMQNGGTNLGGFIGSISNKPAKEVSFVDCYAAGEVGSIDTKTSGTSRTVGGFIGKSGYDEYYKTMYGTYENVYYDKQTTAMRELESGQTLDNTVEGQKNGILGLKGVLTSDSDKFGAGLASQPKSSSGKSFDEVFGFTGFKDDVYQNNSLIVDNASWVYDGGNKDSDLHNCMYPQLSVFFNSDDAFVRAYSYASVSTVHEQVWDKSAYGVALPNTTYDTVRDLTMRFTMTSYVDNDKDRNAQIIWDQDNTMSTIYPSDQRKVIGFFDKTLSSKYDRDYWTSDKFAPGIEWVKVKVNLVDSSGQQVVGSRRLRVIPTMNLAPGKDQIDLLTGSDYDHAKDMYMAYSTATNLTSNSITTGVYPDSLPFQTDDPRSLIQTNTNDAELMNLFNKYKGQFRVPTKYMTEVTSDFDNNNGIKNPTNVVNTKMYRVKSFEEMNNVVKISYDKTTDLLLDFDLLKNNDPTAKVWADKITGKQAFAKEDIGRYLIEYEWVMPDGRFMRDSKMIMIQDGKHDVGLNVYNAKDGKANADLVALDVKDFQYGDTLPTLSFGVPSASTESVVEHFTPVVLGFKNLFDTTTIDKIEFVVTTADINATLTTQTVAFPKVEDGASVSVPTSYVYSSYEEAGQYFAKVVKTDRVYTLHYDAANKYYYITIDTQFKDGVTGLQRYDVESDMKLNIYVSTAPVNEEGTLSILNKTFLNGKEVNKEDEFIYRIVGPNGFDDSFTLDSLAASNQVNMPLPIGDYTMTQTRKPNGYALDKVMIDTKEVKDVYRFTIADGKETSIVIYNSMTTNNDPTQKPVTPTKPNKPTTKPGSVDTGDSKMVLIYLLLVLVSGLAIKVLNDRRLDN